MRWLIGLVTLRITAISGGDHRDQNSEGMIVQARRPPALRLSTAALTDRETPPGIRGVTCL